MAIVFRKLPINETIHSGIRPGSKNDEYKTRIELLCEIAEEASSITEVSRLLERIIKVTRHTLSASKATLFLNDRENGGLSSSMTVHDPESSEADKDVTSKELEIAGWVGVHITPLLIADFSLDIRFGQDITEYADKITRSVAAVPIMREKNVIGVLQVVNKQHKDEFSENDLQLLKSFATTEVLVLLVSMALIANNNINSLALDHALLDGYRSTAEAWASTADIKDTYAYAHSRRVREYALMAANRLSLPPQDLQAIEFGALLHDIGKIGIDSDILCKPGPLSDEEWKIMHEHSIIGAYVIGEIPFLKDAKDIVLYHHERYDGKGYPKRLKEEEIPLGARLVAVADAFDTMTTDHAYRNALNVREALDALIDGIGTQFCPTAVEAFVSAFKKCDGKLPMEKMHSDTKPPAVLEEKPGPAETSEIVERVAVEHKQQPVIDRDFFRGDIRLMVAINTGARELRHLREELMKIEGVKVIIIGSSEEEGHSILISVKEPTPLISLLREIPCVEFVEKKGKDLLITLINPAK